MPRARRKSDPPAAPNPGEPRALRDFVTGFFALTGCTPRDRGHILQVTLPPELGEHLGAPELKLAFQANEHLGAEVHLMQPGSVMLERMVSYLRERSQAALGEVPAARPVDGALPPEIDFRCEARLARVEVEPEEYATFNFRISYICDEKNEELWSVTVDSEGRPVDSPEILARLAAAQPAPGEVDTSRRALGAFYAAAEERARAHAEQAAIGYERETLPRLYRAVARLRAFYQAQTGELDPRVEQEASLRDHYERELRLRTEEEVNNHRMTIALALLNYRVVRVPHARLHVRLSRPRARRTHVFERDLSTGSLLPQACEACGGPLQGADLCAESHLVCPECVRPCALCGRAGCTQCGVEKCARCEREVCAECRVTCAACENVVCVEHSAACPVCSRPACDACLGECKACGTRQCALHLSPCGVCGESVCTQCQETCALCGGHFCPEHTATCARCGQVVCSEHLGACDVCGAMRCHSHLGACRVCGKRLCEEHIHECAGCGAGVCEEHAERCAVCGAGVCAACGTRCAVTGRALCREHAILCLICGQTMTPGHAAVCSLCGQECCPEHSAECSGCGAVLCAAHFLPCALCGAPLCAGCRPTSGICPTCSDPEAGEGIPAEEILAVPGLPEEWRGRVQRAAWRRIHQRERTVLYGFRLFRMIVLLMDSDGAFVSAREVSSMGLGGPGAFAE